MTRLYLSPMRVLFIFLTAAVVTNWPSAARAQFSPAPGTYELANGARGSATLRLALAEGAEPTRLVGVKNGRERSFRPAEIIAFSVAGRRFVRVDNFRFHSGTAAGSAEPALLETVETGAVELFNYYYQVEMGTNFKAHVALPVLRKAGTSTFFAYSPGRSPGLNAALAPNGFVAALFPADAALQRQLATGSLARAQLAAAVRAYNLGNKH